MPSPLPSGTPAPGFALTAVATRRDFRLADFRGRAILLIFAEATGASASRDIVIALRRRYPDFAALAIAVVVDLRIVPGLLKGVAEGIMEAAYKQAAVEVPAGYDAADHLILLQDWNGAVTKAYGADGVGKQLTLVLIDAEGRVRGHYRGDLPVEGSLALVSSLMPGSGPAH